MKFNNLSPNILYFIHDKCQHLKFGETIRTREVFEKFPDIPADNIKDIVVFSHQQHAEAYTKNNPGLFKAGCGECHHDENNNPLELKPGEDVKECIECHTNPGRMPSKERRAMRKAKLSKAEKNRKR